MLLGMPELWTPLITVMEGAMWEFHYLLTLQDQKEIDMESFHFKGMAPENDAIWEKAQKEAKQMGGELAGLRKRIFIGGKLFREVNIRYPFSLSSLREAIERIDVQWKKDPH
jgi:hypothetical protein